MVVGTFNREYVLKTERERVWKASAVDTHINAPKLMTEHISDIEVTGDGGVGTIRKVIYGEANKKIGYTSYKMEELDHENYIIKATAIEGGFAVPRLKGYRLMAKFEVGSKASETLVKFTFEYETKDEAPLTVEEQEELIKLFYLIVTSADDHLTANPTAYA